MIMMAITPMMAIVNFMSSTTLVTHYFLRKLVHFKTHEGAIGYCGGAPGIIFSKEKTSRSTFNYYSIKG
jgi:hypothetical protein